MDWMPILCAQRKFARRPVIEPELASTIKDSTMTEPTVTVIIEGRTYRLCASDTSALRDMPTGDRQHLMTLLQELQRQDGLSRVAVQNALEHARSTSLPSANASGVGVSLAEQGKSPERLGSGDIDAVMARLVVEENRSRKPALTAPRLYKMVGMFAVAVILLVLIF
jgi:hypothetical protein